MACFFPLVVYLCQNVFLGFIMTTSQPKVKVFVVTTSMRILRPSASERTRAGFFPSRACSVLASACTWPFLWKVLGVSLVPKFLYKHFLCKANT